MLLLIVPIVIQVLLIVHVLKTGRNQLWIWVLASLPLAGGIAYVAVEMIPEFWRGRTAQRTARSVRMNFNEESILGKTGTCSHAGTRFGWFASYANTDIGRIVTVVFLRGGRPTYGPKAAEIAGRMYRNLYDHNFFVARSAGTLPNAVVEKVSAVPTQQE